MSAPLLYLWSRQRRNAVRRFLGRFTRLRDVPRALLPLVALGLIGFAVVNASERTDASTAPSLLGGTLAVYLLLAFFRGLSDRGIAFEPAEVDFLFPGPFSRTGLVLYHVLSTHAKSWVMVLILFVFFGIKTPNPGMALVGIALTLMTSEHLRVTAALLSVQLTERTVARLQGPLRLLMLAATLFLVFLFVPTLSSQSGLQGAVRDALGQGWTRVVFYPAIATTSLATAASVGDVILPVAGLLASTFATLGILLAIQVPFLEASIATSQKRAAMVARARKRRGMVGSDARRPSRSVRRPSAPLFRGAGAIFWRNLVVARRSGRALFFSSVFSLLFVTPAFLAARSPTYALVFGALLPLFLSSSLSFDFRGEADHMARLKTLPVRPSRLAWAEVGGSSLVALSFQVLLLAALLAFANLRPAQAVLGFLAYVPLTASLLATANLSHLIAPRAPFLAFLLQMGFLVADGLLLLGVHELLAAVGLSGIPLVFAPLLAVQVGVVMLLMALVGRAFARFDVGNATS